MWVGGAIQPIGIADTATGEVMRDDNGWYSDKRLKNILDADVSVSGSLSRLKSLNTVKFKYNDIYWNRYKENMSVSAYKIKEDEEYYGFIADDINQEYVHVDPYDWNHYSISSVIIDQINNRGIITLVNPFDDGAIPKKIVQGI